MNKELKTVLKAFCLELPVYAAVVALYLWVITHYLGDWLARLFHDHRVLYAVVALAVIFAQGGLLEITTRALLPATKARTKK